MKKRLAAIGLILIMAFCTACGGTKKEDAAKETEKAESKQETKVENNGETESGGGGTVSVGCTVQLTGPNQLTGSYYKNGVQMAVDEINANGGILGKQISIEYADEGSDPQTAVNACEKLISSNVTCIFGSITSTNCKAMLPSVMAAETPYFALGSNSNMADEGEPWLWQVRVRDSNTAPIMAQVFAEDVGVKNPAIVYNTAESTTLSTEAFIETYKGMGLEINDANVYAFTEDETNFGNIITQIMNSDCDGIVANIVNSNQAVIFAQQLLSSGYDGPKIGNSVFSSPEFRSADATAAEGWYIVNEWTASLLGDGIPEEIPAEAIDFEKKYEELYGIESGSVSVQGYDSVYLFKAACEAADSTDDKAAINEAMQKVAMQGAGNKYEYHDNNTITTYILLLQNKDGQSVPSAVVPVSK